MTQRPPRNQPGTGALARDIAVPSGWWKGNGTRKENQMHPLAQDISTAGETLADAIAHEQMLEDRRAEFKQAAILRLMQTTNPATNKLHSGSSAESVVETDPEYAQYRERQRDAVTRTLLARARYHAAIANAHLAVLSPVLQEVA